MWERTSASLSLYLSLISITHTPAIPPAVSQSLSNLRLSYITLFNFSLLCFSLFLEQRRRNLLIFQSVTQAQSDRGAYMQLSRKKKRASLILESVW